MGLSTIGIFHTIIGLIAIVAAIVSYIRYRKINLAELSGKIYFYGTAITSLTALGISKHGGFNAGHILSLLVFILVLTAQILYVRKEGNNMSRYIENFCLSFSFFLSWLPTVNETFTRIPIGHPLAKNIGDPLIARTLLLLFILFIAGSIFQFLNQKKLNKAIANK